MADCPLRQRIAPHQGPFEQARRCRDQRVHVRVPSLVVVGALLCGALRGPRLHLPIVPFLDADEIHQLAGAQRIVDHMATDSDPVSCVVATDVLRHPLDRDHAAPCDHAKKARTVAAEQLMTDDRMHPVGADQGIALDGLAALELKRHPALVLRHAGGAPTKMDRVRLLGTHRIDQHLQKVGAEHGDVGKAVALDRLGAEIEQFPGPAGVPQADLLAFGIARELPQRLQDTERVQGAGAVRADLNTGAEFLEFGSLLIDVDVMTAIDQRERRRHAADAAASDEDVMGQAGTFPAALPKFESCQTICGSALIVEFPAAGKLAGNFWKFRAIPASSGGFGSQPPSGFNSLQPIPCPSENSEIFSPEQGIHTSEQGIHPRHGRACPHKR